MVSRGAEEQKSRRAMEIVLLSLMLGRLKDDDVEGEGEGEGKGKDEDNFEAFLTFLF